MAYRMYGALIGPLSVAVLMLAANDSFAQGGARRAPRGNSLAAFGSASAGGRASQAKPSGGVLAGNRRRLLWAVATAKPMAADINQSITGDIRYTYTQDVPWDWPHRFPPMVAPSDRPYVQSCAAEAVTVPGRNGAERTVNIMRCY